MNNECILLNEDTYEALKKIEDKRFDLVITSPPYNVGKEYETKKSIEEYLKSHKRVIRELVRVVSDKGHICWQVGNYVEKGEVFPLDIFYYQIFKEFNVKLRNRIIWTFGHGLHASKRFSGRYETILWFSKNDNYIFNLDSVRVPSKYPGKRHYKGEKKGQLSGNPLGKNPSDMWHIIEKDWTNEIWNIPNVKFNHPEKTEHPCQYPVELVERCILALTHKDSWILDPYSGVGSTVIAGLKNGRNVIGIDKEKKYTEITNERITRLEQGTLKLRPITKNVYQPTGAEKISRYPEEWRQDIKDENKPV